MTDENRRFNLQRELQASDEEWEVAGRLAELGYLRQAVGRYYYAVYHAARAALLSRGLEPATHSGMVTEFHRVFVHQGLLEARRARALGRLQRDREEAEYAPAIQFSPEDVVAARGSAADLREFVTTLLSGEGWLA